MAVTDFFTLRGGFISGDVIRWRDPVWEKGRKKSYTGEGFGGQQLMCVGRRTISAAVIEGPDEDGWVTVQVMQYDNHGMTPLDEIFMAPPVKKKKIRRKYRTLMNEEAEIERLPWEDERARARLVSEVWGDKDHEHWMSMGMDEDED